MSMDRNQTSEAPSTTKERYLALTSLVEHQRFKLTDVKDPELLRVIQEVNTLPHIDQTPTERLMDARLFRALTRCGKAKLRRLSGGFEPRSPLEMLEAVRQKYKIEEPRVSMDGDAWEALETRTPIIKMDWERMGEEMMWMFNCPQGTRCMKGFMSGIEKKQQAQSQPRRKRDLPQGAAAAPEQHAARELTSSTTQTEKLVNKLWVSLKEVGTNEISLQQLAVDHDSYPQTVINSFTMMFLIKDGKVRVRVCDDGTLMIKQTTERPSRPIPELTRQIFISMTLTLWEKWKLELPRSICNMTKNDDGAVDDVAEGESDDGGVRISAVCDVEPSKASRPVECLWSPTENQRRRRLG